MRVDQLPLDLSARTPSPFDAENFEHFKGQLADVLAFMRDGEKHTLKEIAAACRCETQSASARIRQMRNELGLTVNKYKTDAPRVYAYRLEGEG